MIRSKKTVRPRTLLVAATMALLMAGFVLAAGAQASAPAWRVLGVTGPTNLPPTTNEIQKVAVKATDGTFTLSFQGQTTSTIAFNASASSLEATLDGLSTIGGAGGSAQVSGGPGEAGGTSPYYVQFAGALSDVDVPQMTANSSLLSGGTGAVVSTQAEGDTAGEVMIYISNIGGVPSTVAPVTLDIELPPGITTTASTPIGADWACTAGTGQSSPSCIRTTPIAPSFTGPTVAVPVSVGIGAAPESEILIKVEGGGAAEAYEYHEPVIISSQPAAAGVQAFWAGAFDADGRPSRQAGGHPFSAGTGFLVNTVRSPAGEIVPAGDLKDVEVDLPPGFLGTPTVTDRCPRYQLVNPVAAEACPSTAIIGRAQTSLGTFNGASYFPSVGVGAAVFNDEPSFGYAAEFAFPVVTAQAVTVGSLRSDGDYGVTISAPNIPFYYKFFGAFVTLQGNPSGAAGRAFLVNPTNCAEEMMTPPTTAIRTNSWQGSSVFDRDVVNIPAVQGCDKLDFEPEFSFKPSTNQAASVFAAVAHLHIDQAGLTDPTKEAPPHLKHSVVALPQGLTLNPAAANGLQACSTRQIGLKGTGFSMPSPIRFDKSHPTCPDASKIGTVNVSTPLLDESLDGTVYLAAQDDNPFKALIALYLVIDDARTGTIVKLPGEVRTDAETGQMTAIFTNNPQLPIEDLTLDIRGGGPRSALATPDVCAAYTTKGEFTPWSAPESGPPAQTRDSFTIARGVGGSAVCPRTKVERPFDLGFQAGTTEPVAGAHSPFTLRITRPDGNQELDRIQLTTPPGFLATLKGVDICSPGALNAAEAPGRTGAQEIASPSCPASSQVGTTTIGAGVGSQPLYVKTGKIYLTGPYKGAPASLAFIVPAVAGPFDLGVQVVRTALKVNPVNAQVTAESDSIPQILKGIPLLIRDVQVNLDRPGFILNPTNCEAMGISGKATGGSGAAANLSTRFQVGHCKALAFKPNLAIQLHGGTKRGKYQRLIATVTAKPGEANIARAAVSLPHSEFLAQEHIRTVCTRVQFAAHACPAGSIYGHATAITPLLDGSLTGPVYLRSSSNPLPDLVAALRGPDSTPIEVELSGRTDSKNGGIRNTFDVVPDAPVTKFTLQLKGGKKSLIVNSRNLCASKQRATVRFSGQNGRVRNFRPVVKNDCRKKGRKGKKSSVRPGKRQRLSLEGLISQW